MPFEIGRGKTGGRQVGTPNRFTGAFREAVQIVYDGLGGHDAFLEWARENPTEYYRIAARLIPGEMRTEDNEQKVVVIVDRGGYRNQSQIEANPSNKPLIESHECRHAG